MRSPRRAAALGLSALCLGLLPALAACASPDVDRTRSLSATDPSGRPAGTVWDVRVTAVTDPYQGGDITLAATRHAVLVSFTATNVSKHAADFRTAGTFGLVDSGGGSWFDLAPTDAASGTIDADADAVPTGGTTSGSVVFPVRNDIPTDHLVLVVGKELDIRPVGGIPPGSYVVPLTGS